MHAPAIAEEDLVGQRLPAQRRIGLSERLDGLDHLGGELARALWPTPLGYQTPEPLLFECLPGLVKGRTGETESLGRALDAPTVAFDAAEHLVLDLHEIARIEESVRLEELVLNLVGLCIERACTAQ